VSEGLIKAERNAPLFAGALRTTSYSILPASSALSVGFSATGNKIGALVRQLLADSLRVGNTHDNQIRSPARRSPG